MLVIIAQNLYSAKVCEVNLRYDKSIFDNITHYEQQRIEVQNYVAEPLAFGGVLPVCTELTC